MRANFLWVGADLVVNQGQHRRRGRTQCRTGRLTERQIDSPGRIGSRVAKRGYGKSLRGRAYRESQSPTRRRVIRARLRRSWACRIINGNIRILWLGIVQRHRDGCGLTLGYRVAAGGELEGRLRITGRRGLPQRMVISAIQEQQPKADTAQAQGQSPVSPKLWNHNPSPFGKNDADGIELERMGHASAMRTEPLLA